MMFLIMSFCWRRCSLLLHHMGRLYSHFKPRCLHALQLGLPSSHFFRLSRHVKQPKCSIVSHGACRQKNSYSPVRERRCILEDVCLEAAEVVGAAMLAPGLLEDGVFDEAIGKSTYNLEDSQPNTEGVESTGTSKRKDSASRETRATIKLEACPASF